MQAPSKKIRQTIIIRKIKKSDGRALLGLIDALADFEKLKRPSRPARNRLLRDAFGINRRFDTFLACLHGKPVGYAIVFETYSSFRAQPTLYLEDIFILPEFRNLGVGAQLFDYCVSEAKRRKCGRFEWVVLDWNTNAIRFYERRNATRMNEWLLYRIEL
jgi:GNAT superfamily N-acetyltransferase